MNLLHSRTASVFFFLLTRVATLILALGVLVVLARTLNVADMGIFTSSIAISITLSAVADLGFSSYAMRESVRRPKMTRSVVRSAFRARLILGTLFFLVLCLVVLLLPSLRESELALPLVLAGLSVPLNSLQVYANFLQRSGLFMIVSISTIVQSVLWAGTVVFLKYISDLDVAHYVIGQVICGNAVLIYLAIAARQVPIYRNSPSGITTPTLTLLRESTTIGVTSLVTSLYYRLSSVMVIAVAGPVQAGYFGVASRFLDQAAVLPNTIGAAFTPSVNAAHTLGHRQVLVSARAFCRYLLVLAIPASIAGFVWAEDLLVSLFGSQYEAGANSLRILSLSFPLLCLGWSFTSAVISEGKSRDQIYVAVAGLLVAAPASFALSYYFGSTGAAASVLLTETTVCVGLLIILRPSAHAVVPWRAAALSTALASLTFGLPRLFGVTAWIGLLIGLSAYIVFAMFTGLIDKSKLRIPSEMA